MTISPLMELFPNWYDGPAENWPPGHFYWEDVWGAFPRAMSACGVDHQSKRRDMKIKSTFNISFQIHFVCFVLKKKSHCFLNFIGCCLRFAYSMMQLFCRKVGWWSCVMVTVLLKKQIGNDVSFSSMFLEAICQNPLDYFFSNRVCCLSIRKTCRSSFFTIDAWTPIAFGTPVTRVNWFNSGYKPHILAEAPTLHVIRPKRGVGRRSCFARTASASALMLHVFRRQRGKPCAMPVSTTSAQPLAVSSRWLFTNQTPPLPSLLPRPPTH